MLRLFTPMPEDGPKFLLNLQPATWSWSWFPENPPAGSPLCSAAAMLWDDALRWAYTGQQPATSLPTPASSSTSAPCCQPGFQWRLELRCQAEMWTRILSQQLCRGSADLPQGDGAGSRGWHLNQHGKTCSSSGTRHPTSLCLSPRTAWEREVTSDFMGREEDICIDQSLVKSLTSHSTGTESCKRGRQKRPTEATWQVQDSRAELGREAQKDKPCYNVNKFPIWKYWIFFFHRVFFSFC